MATQLKTELQQRVQRDMRDAGLDDVVFPSFVKEVGYRMPLSASDVVYAVQALLEAPHGNPAGEAQVDADAPRPRSANFFLAYKALDPYVAAVARVDA
jgi:hypothetical protein